MATSIVAAYVDNFLENKMQQPPMKKPTTKQEMLEWIEWAEAKMKALEARVSALKEENVKHKQTIRQMDRRIMRG